MTLIVEDGTGVEDAEALCTVAEADTYHENRGNTGTWNALETTRKEELLRAGYDYLRARFAGTWPCDEDIFGVIEEAVPRDLKFANALSALKAKTGNLMGETKPQLIRQKTGPLESEWAKSTTGGARVFPDVDALVVPYTEASSPYSMRLERS